jgi:hypothetical protein
MRVQKNENGLFVFPLTVRTAKGEKVFQGLIDTGSNTCVCTYKIPVALRSRATSFKRIAIPASDKEIHTIGYSMKLGFGNRSEMTHVYRLPLNMEGIDFILGTSFLNLCKITVTENYMDIEWA